KSPSFSFHASPPSEIYTLSLHDALPIFHQARHADDGRADDPVRRHGLDGAVGEPGQSVCVDRARGYARIWAGRLLRRLSEGPSRSEEHTSELQSLRHLVCRLLLEKKNDK